MEAVLTVHLSANYELIDCSISVQCDKFCRLYSALIIIIIIIRLCVPYDLGEKVKNSKMGEKTDKKRESTRSTHKGHKKNFWGSGSSEFINHSFISLHSC